jgi:nicotinic acid mononucleotide adenylyltransferase
MAVQRSSTVPQEMIGQLSTHLRMQGDAEAPLVMLLCGEDLLKSFCAEGVWKEEDIAAIFEQHAVVCVTRPDSDGATLATNQVQISVGCVAQ